MSELAWLIVPRGLSNVPLPGVEEAEMRRCKPPLKVFPGVPTSKANMNHAGHWGSFLGGRCPPALWADPRPCNKGDAVGPDNRGVGGGQMGRLWAAWGGLSPALKVLPL